MVNLSEREQAEKTLTSVPVVPIAELSPQVFSSHYQQPGLPVVIQGLLDQSVDWNLEYLCETLDDALFLIRCYGQQRYQHNKREWSNIGSGVDVVQMPFRDYAVCLRNGQAQAEDMYLAKCALGSTALGKTDSLKDLGDRLPLRKPMSDFNLWVGPSGHVECLHYDPMDGTLVQLHGTKKIVLFPPSQSRNLYPFPVISHLKHGLRLRCWFSQVTIVSPDFEAYPNLREAFTHRMEVILQPGEALYIPAGWWHEVTTLGTEMGCSVNRFWRVFPTQRAVLSWQRWRVYLGSAAAVPYTLIHVAKALLSKRPRQKLAEIWRLI